MENKSLELDFLSALHTCPSKHRSHSKTHHSQCLTQSHSLSLTFNLIPSHSHSHSLSLRRWISFAPSPSLHRLISFASSHSIAIASSRFIAVAPFRSIAPSSPRSAFFPQTLILGGSAGSLSQK